MTFIIEGMDSFNTGMKWFECPYRIGTCAREYWLRGWRQAAFDR